MVSFLIFAFFAFAYVFSHNIHLIFHLVTHLVVFFFSIYRYFHLIAFKFDIQISLSCGWKSCYFINFFYHSPICLHKICNEIQLEFNLKNYYPLRCKTTEQTSNMADCVISFNPNAQALCTFRQSEKSSKIAQFNSQANTNANEDDRHHSANRTYTHTYICYVCACYIQYIVYVHI